MCKSIGCASGCMFIFRIRGGNRNLVCFPRSNGSYALGNSAASFGFGGGGGFSADLRLNTLPLFFFRLDSTYSYIPIATKDAVSVYSVTAGGGITYSPVNRLNLCAYGRGDTFTAL